MRISDWSSDVCSADLGVDEFIADLEAIDTSLAHHRGDHAGRFALQRVLRRVRGFGFHLAALDLRQDSAVHEEALAALLDDADWASRAADAQVDRLHGVLDGRSEEHTSELQSLMRTSYAVFCLKKKNKLHYKKNKIQIVKQK